MSRCSLAAALLAVGVVTAGAQTMPGANPYARDPKQPVDQAYTAKIEAYTTAPYFTSPLVDYLPASKTVPTPMAVLKDVAGAPGILPYSTEVYQYMRMVEKATPRVKVFSIGKTEEGREMIAVAVSSEANISKLEANRANLAKLADPRTIGMDDGQADRIIGSTVPIYYITGTIHSPETGAPTALMELVYRLAVDDSPYIQKIRKNVVTLITPIVEVDGRDREVDVYRWHLANPGKNWPSTLYWGHYVAHDNNRDAMGLTLALSRNVLNTYVDFHAQVLHDLHESVAYLYDNTIGDGPYNAWIDPILAGEWRMIGWNNVSEMTKFGMPGVFAHGTFDTWSPGYLMFIAALHNGISRLYETFGNGGADTVDRTLRPSETSRTWYRQDPPLPRAKWSQRNNNNYEETGLLVSLNQFADNGAYFLKNFYLKSKRSILKAKTEGPAAYVFPGDDPRPGAQADLLHILQLQRVEISRATQPFTVMVPAKKRPSRQGDNGGENAQGSQENAPGRSGQPARPVPPPAESHTFPAGSYIVRMDQPFSRIADALLDYQYWAPDDPQRQPYDDTAWTFPELFDVKAYRVTDTKVLDAPMAAVKDDVPSPGGVKGTGTVYAIDNNTDPSLITLRYQLKDATIAIAEEPFSAGGQQFNRGSFLVSNVNAADLNKAAADLGLSAVALPAAPSVKTHPGRAARIAILHTWLSTQDEGWWRETLDFRKVPYTYISTQDLAKQDLRAKYDVILFPPVGRASGQVLVTGMPMYGNPIPWKTTELTPNIGKIDSSDDIRPGMGWDGLAHLQQFVRDGGVLVTVNDSAAFAIDYGFTPGLSTSRAQRLKLIGTVVKSKVVDAASPIAYGYGDTLSVYADSPPIFGVSASVGGRGGRRGGDAAAERPTGRGTADDPDVVQGRPTSEGESVVEQPKVEPWQYALPTDEQLRNGISIIPPAQRPRVVLRYGDARDLLVSGLLDGGTEIAQHPMVIDVPVEKGHVVAFSNNPIWRGETQGSYALVFNTILNWDNLDAGRKLDAK
ncbi:MAG TPA: M14 family zinc carboxypeptidase [Vicinamibacterales bacterium]|nr:M14 family zinc carboxypeptidase [Vicinamibacterales bacterium]